LTRTTTGGPFHVPQRCIRLDRRSTIFKTRSRAVPARVGPVQPRPAVTWRPTLRSYSPPWAPVRTTTVPDKNQTTPLTAGPAHHHDHRSQCNRNVTGPVGDSSPSRSAHSTAILRATTLLTMPLAEPLPWPSGQSNQPHSFRYSRGGAGRQEGNIPFFL
jgi:hypothetical protein